MTKKVVTNRKRGQKMRGFNEYKQAKSPVLGEKAYFAFIKGQELKNNKTENAKRWFETPPYYLLCRKENKNEQ